MCTKALRIKRSVRFDQPSYVTSATSSRRADQCQAHWGDSVEALSDDSSLSTVWESEELEDPLLELLRTGILLPKEQFLVELEKQRLASPERYTDN